MTNTPWSREGEKLGREWKEREREIEEEMTGNARSSCSRAFSEFCREELRRGPPSFLFFFFFFNDDFLLFLACSCCFLFHAKRGRWLRSHGLIVVAPMKISQNSSLCEWSCSTSEAERRSEPCVSSSSPSRVSSERETTCSVIDWNRRERNREIGREESRKSRREKTSLSRSLGKKVTSFNWGKLVSNREKRTPVVLTYMYTHTCVRNSAHARNTINLKEDENASNDGASCCYRPGGFFFSFLRSLRERAAFGGCFQPSSACLSEKKEIRMQQNVDLARAVLLSQRFPRGR